MIHQFMELNSTTLRVDLQSLHQVSYQCLPVLCHQGPSCCRHYQVSACDDEIDALVGLLPQCAAYQPALDGRTKPFRVVDHFDDGKLYCLDTDEQGTCCLAFSGKEDETLCSIHAVCLDLQLEPFQHKPTACVLWPLLVIDDDVPLLCLQEEAHAFACITKDPKNTGLDRHLAEIVTTFYGQKAAHEIDAALRQHG